jgi:methyl-accepting chemotaxis protein
MGQIVDSVRQVATIMAEITAASHAQSAGIQDIGTAITSMDEMTQQNSALVEEASAAAESLQDQADQLSSALAVFKLSTVSDKASAAASFRSEPALSGGADAHLRLTRS